jgi:hypothetical protein
MRKYKRILLVVMLVGTAFVVGYGSMAAFAAYGRANNRGYFHNDFDNVGDYVWRPTVWPNNNPTPGCSGDGDYAIPLSVNTKQEFINYVKCKLDSTADNSHVRKQDRVGAAFIIQTMRGLDGADAGCERANCRPSNSEIADWENRINNPTVTFRSNTMRSFTVNSYYQGNPPTDNSSPNDDAFYNDSGTQTAFVFSGGTAATTYVIRHFCANPVGTGSLPPASEYALSPHVDNVSPSEVEPGSRVSVQTSVDNVGNAQSNPTQWEITKMIVQPGQTAPNEGGGVAHSDTAPCESGGGAASGNFFQNGGTTCENVARRTDTFSSGSPASRPQPSVSGIEVGDLPVGTRICFALSVQPRSSSSGQWAHSEPVCTVVGKKPKVQIWGNDLGVRGEIETSTTIKNVNGTTSIFGSWVEYGVFAVGDVDGFGSGTGLNNQTVLEQPAWSKFTFANVDNNGNPAFGNYTGESNFRPLANIAGYFRSLPNASPIGNSVDVDNVTFATGEPAQVRTTNAANLTITGGELPKGRSAVIVASGTVTITGNITYTDEVLNRVNDIPQVVIIARDILIQDNVSRIDAWLVADNTINTCANVTGRLTSEKCNTLLEVNGPVVTNRLLLNRTAGSGAGDESDDPAERFNLRPDAFLWGRLQASGSSKAQTVYTVELPPRF